MKEECTIVIVLYVHVKTAVEFFSSLYINLALSVVCYFHTSEKLSIQIVVLESRLYRASKTLQFAYFQSGT